MPMPNQNLERASSELRLALVALEQRLRHCAEADGMDAMFAVSAFEKAAHEARQITEKLVNRYPAKESAMKPVTVIDEGQQVYVRFGTPPKDTTDVRVFPSIEHARAYLALHGITEYEVV